MVEGGRRSEAATTAPRGARHFVRESLEGWDGSTIDDAVLLVSEIATGSMAASGAAAIRINVLSTAGIIRVEVHHPSCRSDRHRYDDVPDHSTGVVGTLADRWGVTDESGGRIVWFELDGDGQSPRRRQRNR